MHISFGLNWKGVRFRVSKFNYDVFYDRRRQCIIAVSKQNIQKNKQWNYKAKLERIKYRKIIPSEEEMYVKRYGLEYNG